MDADSAQAGTFGQDFGRTIRAEKSRIWCNVLIKLRCSDFTEPQNGVGARIEPQKRALSGWELANVMVEIVVGGPSVGSREATQPKSQPLHGAEPRFS